MFEPKVVAISATVGFALSFLIGVFSGAAFLAILVRALIMAVFSGALVVALRFAVIRFLPELTEPSIAEKDEVSETGQTVNITIDGNEPDHDIFSGADARNFGEMVPDFLSGETRAEAEESREKENGGFVPLYPVKPLASVESLSGGASPQDSAAARTIPGDAHKATVGGLDVLPDIQDFVPQTRDSGGDEGFGGEESATGGTISGFGGDESMSRSSYAEMEGKMSGIESETMVKAIRTILSREG